MKAWSFISKRHKNNTIHLLQDSFFGLKVACAIGAEWGKPTHQSHRLILIRQKPVTRGQNNSIKMGENESSNSWILWFTNFETLLYLTIAHGPMFHASCSLHAPHTQLPSYLKTACFIWGYKHRLLLLYRVTYG